MLWDILYIGRFDKYHFSENMSKSSINWKSIWRKIVSFWFTIILLRMYICSENWFFRKMKIVWQCWGIDLKLKIELNRNSLVGGCGHMNGRKTVINPIILKEFLQKLSSGSVILLTITFKMRMILQTIWRRVVGNVLIDFSPSIILLTLLLPAKYHQTCAAAFGRCEH